MKEVKKMSFLISALTFLSYSAVFSVGMAIEHIFFYPTSHEMHLVWNFFLLSCATVIWFFVVAPKRKQLVERVEALLKREQERIEILLDETKKLQREKEQLSAEKMHFIDVGGHELNSALTPVYAVVSQLAGLNPKEDFKKIKVFLPLLQENLRKLMHLTNDLLDLARIDAGRKKVALDEISKEIFLEILNNLSKQIFEPICRRYSRSIQFQVDLSASFRKICVDRSLLELILSNLLSNAAKYTLQGYVTVRAEEYEDCAVIEVCDTGIGIDEKHLKGIFEPFGRAHDPRQLQVESTGLGLSIVRRAVELLDGDLEVESRLGEGSKFILKLNKKKGGSV